MTGRPAVIVHDDDRMLANGLSAHLGDVGVLQATTGDDVGRLLTSSHEVAVLVSRLNGDAAREWERLGIIREVMPTLPIVAYLEPDAVEWDLERGPCPANSIVRAPADPEELARLVRVTGRLVRPGQPGGPDPREGRDGRRHLAVVGLGGGVGTSLVAGVLGARLSVESPVVLGDLDAHHGSLAAALRVQPQYTTEDLQNVVGEPNRLDDTLSVCLAEVTRSLRLLAGPDVVDAPLEPWMHRHLLSSLTRIFPTTVTDFGNLPLHGFECLSMATDVVLVASHDVNVVRRVLPAIDRLGDLAAGTRIRLVLNLVDEEEPNSPAELGRAIGRRWDAIIPRRAVIARAWNDVAGPGLADPDNKALRSTDRHLSHLVDLGPAPRRGRWSGLRSSFDHLAEGGANDD